MKNQLTKIVRFSILFIILALCSCNNGKLSNPKAEELLKNEYPRYITSIVRINDNSLSPGIPNELKFLTEKGLASYNYIPPGNYGYGCYGQLTDEGKQYLVSSIDNEFIVLAIAKVDLDMVTGIREDPSMNASEVEYTEKIVEITPVGEIYSDISIGKNYSVSATFQKYNDGWRMEKLSTNSVKF